MSERMNRNIPKW